ncbi:glycerophosphodiester phosphodiesterase family protein [Actinotignum sp. GS-2025a]|uniref:glycerophosphodiester phosphodiesterase family protein n=1 Tax=Actinotignum sp. GS-2025a TaxID=3427274 RepID=UPI003F4725C1
MGRLYDIDGPALIIAHRGGGNEYPENSLRAFEALYRAGFRHIESDVHATADGVAVILHDPLLDRTTDGVGPISAHTWAEVAQVRNEAGERPPRLDEVLDAFPDAVFNLDAKSDAAVEPLVAAVRRTGAAGRVCLASFSQARVERMRSRLPGATFSLGRSAVAWLMALSRLPGVQGVRIAKFPGSQRGFQAVQVPVDIALPRPRSLPRLRSLPGLRSLPRPWPLSRSSRSPRAGDESGSGTLGHPVPVLTARFVQLAHAQGLAVHAWTINSAVEAEGLLDLGVDGIITDEPSAMRSYFDNSQYSVRI